VDLWDFPPGLYNGLYEKDGNPLDNENPSDDDDGNPLDDDDGNPLPAPAKADAAPTTKATVRQGLMAALNQQQRDLEASRPGYVADEYSIEFVGAGNGPTAIEQARLRPRGRYRRGRLQRWHWSPRRRRRVGALAPDVSLGGRPTPSAFGLTAGVAGTANTGGGAGGGGNSSGSGAAGGSGIVVTNVGTNSTLTITSATASSITGVISGVISLIKSGAGAMTFSGNNT
jgi:hypothetical protein